MKNLYLFLLLLLFAANTAGAQTLRITPTAVEVISAGAKTRAYYAIDDCYFVNTTTGNFRVMDAASGLILFNGDTSEVTAGNSTLWADKFAFLVSLMIEVPYFAENAPATFLPHNGVNYIYKNAGSKVTVVHSRTKNLLWTGPLSDICIGNNSDCLDWLRNNAMVSSHRTDIGILSGGVSIVADEDGAGTNPETNIVGTATSGLVEFVPGSGAAADSTLEYVHITLPVKYTQMFIQLSPANDLSARHYNRILATPASDDKFFIKGSGQAPLTEGATYRWYYQISGYKLLPE